MKGPIPDSYWVVPGRLLAGEYPGAPQEEAARAKLALFREAGVTAFVDLTEPGEYGLLPYEALLQDGVRTIRRAVKDLACPTTDEMGRILDTIDGELECGETVYVYCYGGVGRTGTVVACWLIRHGVSAEAALERIAELRQGTPDGRRESPETREQNAFVRSWRDPARGSMFQVRAYVNRRPDALSRSVLRRFPDLAERRPTLCWTVPRAQRRFAEPQDTAFLEAIGRADLKDELAAFWPKGGPVWDALCVIVFPTGRHGVVLAEGKSYPGELRGRGSQASPDSLARIERALDAAREWLGAASPAESWLGPLYQSANRLAHLYWLREIAGMDAWLANLLFVGDETHGVPHRATSREEWEAEVALVEQELGLAGRGTPYAGHVSLPAFSTGALAP